MLAVREAQRGCITSMEGVQPRMNQQRNALKYFLSACYCNSVKDRRPEGRCAIGTGCQAVQLLPSEHILCSCFHAVVMEPSDGFAWLPSGNTAQPQILSSAQCCPQSSATTCLCITQAKGCSLPMPIFGLFMCGRHCFLMELHMNWLFYFFFLEFSAAFGHRLLETLDRPHALDLLICKCEVQHAELPAL